MEFKKGQRVYWNDPAIDDYPFEEREEALARVWVIESVDNLQGTALIVSEDECSEAEVYTDELEPAPDLKSRYPLYYFIPWPKCRELQERLSKDDSVRHLWSFPDPSFEAGLFVHREWLDKNYPDGL